MISRREFISASSMVTASLGLGLAGARNAKAAWLMGRMQSGAGTSAHQNAEKIVLHNGRLADDPQGQDFARAVYGNRELLAVASEQKVFRPVEGDTGDAATGETITVRNGRVTVELGPAKSKLLEVVV